MKLSKQFHFYAAHRNKLLNDKCSSLHGHQYNVVVEFDFDIRQIDPNGIGPVKFDDIDKYIQLVKQHMDHSTLVHSEDKELFGVFMELGDKCYVMNKPTSAEWLAVELFQLAEDFLDNNSINMRVSKIVLKETNSSTITMDKGDYNLLQTIKQASK